VPSVVEPAEKQQGMPTRAAAATTMIGRSPLTAWRRMVACSRYKARNSFSLFYTRLICGLREGCVPGFIKYNPLLLKNPLATGHPIYQR
jgi:hypothetical protein